MNFRSMMLSVTATALLTFLSLEGFAAGAKIPFTHALSGAIASIDANKLTITHQKNGKPETLNFVLSPATTRSGDLAAGEVVSVHYRMENNQRFATSIQAQRPKTPERSSK